MVRMCSFSFTRWPQSAILDFSKCSTLWETHHPENWGLDPYKQDSGVKKTLSNKKGFTQICLLFYQSMRTIHRPMCAWAVKRSIFRTSILLAINFWRENCWEWIFKKWYYLWSVCPVEHFTLCYTSLTPILRPQIDPISSPKCRQKTYF